MKTTTNVTSEKGGDLSMDLLRELGLTDPAPPLDEVVRVRLDCERLAELDAVEAYVQELGYRQVNRSSLIRAAISAFLDGVQDEYPEIRDRAAALLQTRCAESPGQS